MAWQDIVLSIGQWVFLIALIPSILGKDKPALSTSLMTGSLLIVFAFVYASLFLWVGGVSAFLVGLGWFVLAFQKWQQKQQAERKNEKNPATNL